MSAHVHVSESLDLYAYIDPNTYGEHAATVDPLGDALYGFPNIARRLLGIRSGRHRATADSLLTVDDLRLTLCPITLERAIHIRTDRRLP